MYFKVKNSLRTTQMSSFKYIFIIFFSKKTEAKICITTITQKYLTLIPPNQKNPYFFILLKTSYLLDNFLELCLLHLCPFHQHTRDAPDHRLYTLLFTSLP